MSESIANLPAETTLDGLLNQRVKLEQPAKGFRVAIDTVLLAAAVPAKSGDRVLDMGCGGGGAMLCLAARVPGLSITGVEIQPGLAELCRCNIARNNFDAKMEVIEGDVTKMDLSGFDCVMINPPYYDEASHDVSPNESKRISNAMKKDDLQLWLKTAAKAVSVHAGQALIIIPASRLAEVRKTLFSFFRQIELIPVISKVGGNPNRMILRACKNITEEVDPMLRQCRPIVLHTEGGRFSPVAENILRHMCPIEFIVQSEEKIDII